MANIKVANVALKRLLFIGFGNIPGFTSLHWKESEWVNAADFEAVFINTVPLYQLIKLIEMAYTSDKDNFDMRSFLTLRNNIVKLKREIFQILDSGRNIFVITSPLISVNISQTGNYSMNYIGVYDFLPFNIEVEFEVGEISKTINPAFEQYRKQLRKWQFYFKNESKNFSAYAHTNAQRNYRLIVESLFVNLSNHPLGIELKYGEIPEDFHKENSTKNISGSLYLLHYIPNESIYSALKQLVNSFCNVEIEFSSEPEWLAQIHSPMENVLNPQIANLSSEIDTLTKKRTELLDEIQKYKPWKQLLYETGKPLEEIVLKALELLELENVQPGPKGDHDIVAGFQGESIIFEVKGLTKSAGRQEVFDLYRHLSAFESKHPDKPVRKGILVVNAYRTMAPDLRDKDGRVTFPDDAVKHAVLLEFALLDTRDIYRAVQEIIEGTIQDKQAWFRKIIETVGIYRYSK